MTVNYIPPYRKLYLTLDSIPVGRFCRTIRVPDLPEWVGLVDGVLSELMNAEAWREFGALTPDEMAAAWSDMMFDSWSLAGCLVDDQSPFWDDLDADDAGGSPAVSDYTWSERIEDWAIAAFIAASGVPGAAATYLTIAPRFRLMFRRHDAGGIAKVFIDGTLYAEVDTYSPVPDLMALNVYVP